MTYLKWRVMKILPIPEKWKLSVRYSLIQWTVLARRRREKIISFTLDKDETLIWSLWPWNHLLAWGGLKIFSRRGGQKMASRGGRLAIYPPHAHLWVDSVCPIPWRGNDRSRQLGTKSQIMKRISIASLPGRFVLLTLRNFGALTLIFSKTDQNGSRSSFLFAFAF